MFSPKRSRWPPIFFAFLEIVYHYRLCEASLKNICAWELLGANVLKRPYSDDMTVFKKLFYYLKMEVVKLCDFHWCHAQDGEPKMAGVGMTKLPRCVSHLLSIMRVASYTHIRTCVLEVSRKFLSIGLLHDPVTWYGINYTGTQLPKQRNSNMYQSSPIFLWVVSPTA